MSDVKLPLVGGVSKKTLLIGGAASVAVVGFVYLRKRNSSPASTTPTDTTGTQDPNAIDPNTGLPYGQAGYQDTGYGPTYGAGGYYDPNTGQWVYGNSGTPIGQATTNPAWAQEAEQYLIQNNGADPAALSSALGKYLTGQAVNSTEEGLIDQAIAIAGYPPQGGPSGYPPGIRHQAHGPGADVAVPHVVGEKAGAAFNAIVRAGLKPISDPGQHPTDKVTSTSPKGGTHVPKGSDVLITASPVLNIPGGPGTLKVTVPHVVGQTAGHAHNAIVHAGLVTVDPNASRKGEPRRKVRSQSPSGGAHVTKGSHVTIHT